MADSEGNSPDTNDVSSGLPAAKPLAPAPRVNPPNINAAKEAPPSSGPPGFSDFLEWMRSQAGGESAGTAAQRGPLPKEKKKFQRRDADAKADKPADLQPAGPGPAAKGAPTPAADLPVKRPDGDTDVDQKPSAPVPGSAVGAETPQQRIRRGQAPLKRYPWLALLTQFGVLILLLVSFLVGRWSVSKVTAPPLAAPAAPEAVTGEGKATTKLLSDQNASLIDQAMAAEQDSDFKKAAGLLEQVKASGVHVRGLTFQLAQLAAFQNDYNRALPLLNAALAEGENLGDAYNLRATLVSRSGLIRGSGVSDFETATKIDPFGARNFFYWGEALRRIGKDQAAIVRLKQSVDRLREPELESLYRFKLRLAQIEAGQEKEFAGEMAGHLALANPGLDWLLTAAAIEIHNGKFDAAAGFIERAAQRGDSEVFAARLRDYYLYQFRDKKEISRFFSKATKDKSGAPPPTESPAPDINGPPAIGLDVPNLPPPASPGATLPQ